MRNRTSFSIQSLFCLSFLFLLNSNIVVGQYTLDTLFRFAPQQREIGCMRFFEPFSSPVNLTNAYLLSKFSETLYPERLDLQIRMQQNHGELPPDLISTDELKIHPRVTDTNFLQAFKARFNHFYDYDQIAEQVKWEFIERSVLDTTGAFTGHIVHGQDPECMMVSTPTYVLIIFRGTDDIRNNRFAEWIGTDFNALKTRTDADFGNARVHKGFYKSFKLIEGDIISKLQELQAKEKPIWIAGHSLGGAMAVLTGLSLVQKGYTIGGIYSFGGPSVLGNKRFSAFTDTLLPNKIERFEFALDPVSILKAPGYHTFGHRNWINRPDQGKYQLYSHIPERSFFTIGKLDESFPSKTIKRYIFSSRLSKLPYQLYHHNTQWIVKALFLMNTENMRAHLPLPEDTFPFIYYAWSKSK